jgi:hypothetical protein
VELRDGVSACLPSLLLTATRPHAGGAACPRSPGPRREARASVHHEHHGVGFRDGLLGLACHLHEDALDGAGLQAAGIDGNEGAAAALALAVVPVAGDARQVVHDRVAAARDAVKESRLAYVGAPDQGDDGLHVGASQREREQRAVLRLHQHPAAHLHGRGADGAQAVGIEARDERARIAREDT